MTSTHSPFTVDDCLKGAWAALLVGDVPTRDKLCAMVEKQIDGRSEIPADEPVSFQKEPIPLKSIKIQ